MTNYLHWFITSTDQYISVYCMLGFEKDLVVFVAAHGSPYEQIPLSS
jgi:hypothetical protein